MRVQSCLKRGRFAEALEHSLGEKNANANHDCMVNFTRAFSALISSPLLFKTKKGESDVFVWHFYGRFLSISSPTMAIATIMATVEMAKYISVGGKLTTGYGDTVGAAALTSKAFCEDDGQ